MLYKSKRINRDICICIINDTNEYNPWTRELVKNLADYTITNCTGFGFDVYVDVDEDAMLQKVAEHYKTAVVISAGTEFINGDSFFNELPEDFFLLGHVLDMGDGYYGLHHQCYVLNLEKYCQLGKPNVGKTKLLSKHKQTVPVRSIENVHDDYLPTFIKSPEIKDKKNYKNKYRGWNLISKGIDAGFKIEAFNEKQRQGKYYIYRDVDNTAWLYERYNYCLTRHVFTESTGSVLFPRPYNTPITQLLHPASGMDWYHKLCIHGYTDTTVVKFYDYNKRALEKMRKRVRELSICKFEFYYIDAIHKVEDFVKLIDTSDPVGTVVSMSNIYSYEGTAALLPLKYRAKQENYLIQWAKANIPDAVVDFDQRAAEGIIPYRLETGLAKDLMLTGFSQETLPPWHIYY